MTVMWVALGASVGAVTRYVLAHLLDRRLPSGTILANLVGSFVLGLLTGAALSPETMTLLGVGLCGSLTTYSAFVVQTHDRGPRLGLLNVVLTVPLAVAACASGFALTS